MSERKSKEKKLGDIQGITEAHGDGQTSQRWA